MKEHWPTALKVELKEGLRLDFLSAAALLLLPAMLNCEMAQKFRGCQKEVFYHFQPRSMQHAGQFCQVSEQPSKYFLKRVSRASEDRQYAAPPSSFQRKAWSATCPSMAWTRTRNGGRRPSSAARTTRRRRDNATSRRRHRKVKKG